MYGSGKQTDYKVRCEQCGKWVYSEKKITTYGPDTVKWGDEELPKSHWFCGQACADEWNKRNREA